MADPYQMGVAAALLQQCQTKTAGDAALSYAMTGRLYFSKSGYLLLSVPNALGRGVFDTLNEPGVTLPVSDTTGQYNAHVTVMSPEEVAQIGRDKLTERGHEFAYTLGALRTVEPATWPGVSRVWFLTVQSPALETLRKSYGLSAKPFGGQHDFHITVGIRKKKVLWGNDSSKTETVHHPLKFAKQAGDTLKQLVSERPRVATPTPAQAAAGNYQKGHVIWQGWPVSIENPRGSIRSGTNKAGKSWAVTMKHDYGYFCGTTGKDLDHVDVFIGPEPDTAQVVYVVDQVDPDSGKFDEHKCLIGFPTEAAARKGYLANYSDSWQGLKSITPLTLSQFSWWLEHGDQRRPASGVLVKAAEWRHTPQLVRERFQRGRELQQKLAAVTAQLPALGHGCGQVFWQPTTDICQVVVADDCAAARDWATALCGLPRIKEAAAVTTAPTDSENWILLKFAEGPLQWWHKPFEAAGGLAGGPSPLTNAIVGGLLTGGLGYGVGSLIDAGADDEYVQPGAASRLMGLQGLLAGMSPGLLQGLTNAATSSRANQPLGWRAAITPDKDVPVHPAEVAAFSKQSSCQPLLRAVAAVLPGGSSVLSNHIKQAFEDNAGAFNPLARSIRVDAFNNAIWNDVGYGTSPAVGAGATGLMSGVQQMYGGKDLLSPMHIVKGIAAAGVDMATARLAGGVLGSLGILTPKSQATLQQMGIWGGLVRGVTGSVLGLY